MKTSLIIVAAGKGVRFGQPKAFVPLLGKSLLKWNLETARSLDFVDELIVVIDQEHLDQARQHVADPDIQFISGGEERIDSVMAGVAAASGEIVLIHNVANPFASTEDFQLLYEVLEEESCACFVGQRVVDTLRRIDEEGSETIMRNNVWMVQTPQGFRRQKLLDRFKASEIADLTDEVMLFEGSDIPIQAFETSRRNQKITYPEDLDQAEQTFQGEMLFGIGEDSHPFDESGSMMLGGILVDELPKLKGNSDGDVVLHSLYNAVSSAIGGRSIGPTADPMAEQGILDSSEYLKVVLEEARQQGFTPENVSISLECAKPRVETISDRMKERLSDLLMVPTHRIGITATTGEGLTSFGRGEAVKCVATVSLSRLPSS